MPIEYCRGGYCARGTVRLVWGHSESSCGASLYQRGFLLREFSTNIFVLAQLLLSLPIIHNEGQVVNIQSPPKPCCSSGLSACFEIRSARVYLRSNSLDRHSVRLKCRDQERKSDLLYGWHFLGLLPLYYKVIGQALYCSGRFRTDSRKFANIFTTFEGHNVMQRSVIALLFSVSFF